MPTPASTAASTAVAKARALRDPDTNALAESPETPGELRTVEQVDWTALIINALGPNTTLDKPLPQLLLRLGDVISQLTGNAEQLKGFVDGQGQDLADAMETFDERIKKRNTRRTDIEGRLAQLEVTVERLEAAGATTPTVQPLNL